MLGYHVFYNVTGSKKSYSTTEFYIDESKAKKRALELGIASNIDFVAIRTIELTPILLEVFKGEEHVRKYEE